MRTHTSKTLVAPIGLGFVCSSAIAVLVVGCGAGDELYPLPKAFGGTRTEAEAALWSGLLLSILPPDAWPQPRPF